MNINDPLEIMVADALSTAGIVFRNASEKDGIDQKLDFYLPAHDVYLEVKRFHTPRSNKQLESQDNVILVQGIEAVKFIVQILTKKAG